MTERKPPGVSFESWVEKQIREAQERGEFDDLPGAGKPLPGRDRPVEEQWWLRDYLRREGLPSDALLPTPLQLRKEAERLPETVASLRSEEAVREAVSALNRRIVDWLRAGTGPRVHVAPVDADEIVAGWQAARTPPPAAPSAPEAEERPRRARWWRRRR
ncbi:DnaJ family domain-containing protein [Prauserella endophytica]|uniref:DUF1992 domain-containing protein n=1 Tax=Prauserella endophytica TaxID=1592324 RepID=A0ABY2S5A8_9PSEU|nr:DUF1992 domain-containing protein [Prauserella endophytica]PXY29983.1 molecular chaperone DnaJ [Prauserella coralliicola]TKG71037.1 DUF1992 domain-containing protein [Prauserella endophytica]